MTNYRGKSPGIQSLFLQQRNIPNDSSTTSAVFDSSRQMKYNRQEFSTEAFITKHEETFLCHSSFVNALFSFINVRENKMTDCESRSS
jgi:hypothetical protein